MQITGTIEPKVLISSVFNKVRHAQLHVSPPRGASVLCGIIVAILFTLFAKLGYVLKTKYRYIVVYRCVKKVDGHLFPSNPELKLKWQTAIRKLDEKSKKLWEPAIHDRVCNAVITLQQIVTVSLFN